MLRRYFIPALLSAVLCSSASADIISLNAVDSGFYHDNGSFTSTTGNYAAGWFVGSSPPGELRNFFVFDLTGISGAINSAKLQILMPSTAGYSSPDPAETFTLFDASTPIATLSAHVGSTAIFNDLGTGTAYASADLTGAMSNTVVDIVFNPTGITFLNANRSPIAFGGAIVSFSISDPSTQSVFSNSSASSTRQLVLEVTPVPEPASALLAAAGFAALVLPRRRFRRE